MEAPRPRFTIRCLLAIVTFAAVALGGFAAGARWERHRLGRAALRPYIDPSTRSAGEMISADDL
jgi:hypothetical protein